MPSRVPSGPEDRRALPRITSLRTVPDHFCEGETTRILATVDLLPDEVDAVRETAGDTAGIRAVIADSDAAFAAALSETELQQIGTWLV